MRLPSSLLATALLFIYPTTAIDNALVYLTGSQSTIPSPNLNPPDARFVIAQRLGLSRYHSLDGASEQAISAVNTYASKAQSIFSTHQPQRRRQIFAVIEGVVEPEGLFSDLGLPHFAIESPPSLEQNADLLIDIREHYATEYGVYSVETVILSPDGPATDILSAVDGPEDARPNNQLVLIHQLSTSNLANVHGIKSTAYRQALQNTRRSLELLIRATEMREECELTFILMPYDKTSRALDKRSSPSSWGSYTKVAAREEPETGSGRLDFIPESDKFEFIDTSGAQAAPRPGDAPLPVAAGGENKSAPPTSSPPVGDDAQVQKSNGTTKPPRGILPSCFASNDACTTATHNCSGHGKCTKKYSDTSGSNDITCWSCACSTSREERGESYKTIQWAGPACQKKDVSVPFWLLGGTTIALVSAVTWGVGLLYSMGSEDLPSVIGAGVSSVGARANK